MSKELSTIARIYIALFTALGVAAAVLAVFTWRADNVALFLGLFVTALFSSTLKVKLPGVRGTISVSFLFILIGCVDLSFGETLLIGCGCAIVQLFWRAKSKPRPVQIGFNMSVMALSASAAWLFHNQYARYDGFSPVLLLGLTASVFFTANTVPIAIVIALAEGKSSGRVWKECYFWTFPYYLVGAVIAGVISFTTHKVGWQSSILILPAVYLIYRSYRAYLGRMDEVKKHSIQLSERSEELEREIAERKRTELTLRESQERYRTLFESSPHPMWVYAEDTSRFIEINDAAISRYGYSRTEFLSMTIDEIRYDRPGGEPTDRVPLTDFERVPGASCHRKKTGEAIWVEARSHNIAFRGQKARLVLADDITERRRWEEMRVEKDAAEAASLAKSEFLANMSHELRTPLNAILGYSELLQETAEDDGNTETSSDLAKIHTAGKHLLGLINDILDVSKIEAGKMELFCESFDVADVVSSAVHTVEPLVAKNGNTLTVEAADNIGEMFADMTKTKQVLVNLVSNAAKFTKDGKISLTIRRSAEEGMIEFEIADEGIGMSFDQLQVVGKPFTQADPSTTRKYGGTGLGLVISNRFCEMMGGFITVESEIDKGSTFTIHLPQVSVAAPEASTVTADESEPVSI